MTTQPRRLTSMTTIMTAPGKAGFLVLPSVAAAEMSKVSTRMRFRALPDLAPAVDLARLKGVLQDLIACRQLLDSALKEG